MELGLNRQNIKNVLWHLGVVVSAAVLLEVYNYMQGTNLDPKTMAVFAIVSPLLKLFIESIRKQ